MPLTLVTGPANAAKAGTVLGRLRERLGEEPVLVVPSLEAVEHSRRELAGRGAVFGTRVLRFKLLLDEIARRAGYAPRRASGLQRRLLVEEVVRTAGLTVLSDSAERPGFARAAARFVAELERSMVEPARFTRALRDWAGDGPRRAYADEVALLYRRYRDALEAAGLVDDELFGWRALDALRREPSSWGETPVFVYGFDDFTPLELDALESLARHAGADVTVSLPYEPGREAFRATARAREELAALASEVVALDASDDHYAPEARAALHALERGLFEPAPAPVSSGGAVRLHTAGGERAELELCGAAVLRLLRDGTPAGEIAVVLRDPEAYGSLAEQVLEAYGIPFSIDRRVPFAHTGLGRGLLALLRVALLGGDADDLLAWLRTPGLLRVPGLADRLEAEVRKEGTTSAAAARAIWEGTEGRWALEDIDRLAGARGPEGLLEELDRMVERLFAAPLRRSGRVLDSAELDDARAYRSAHEALSELHALAAAGGGAGLDARKIHDTLADLRVRVGENAQPDRVQVASPEAVRARRFQAVFVCGLQEREFPRPAAPEAFLPDADRREIARAGGLALPLREDQLQRERYLFYVCVSRAERLLVLSARTCDEEGNHQARSFFLDDVREVVSDLAEHGSARSLAEVTWTLGDAPTGVEWERALAAGGPRRPPEPIAPLSDPGALSELAARGPVSAGALEDFAGCPVKWLVEKVLRPEKLEPDPEQVARGSYAHRVLEVTFRRLAEETGDRRVTPENLADAERILLDALEQESGEFRLSPNLTRVRAAVRRLEFDLLGYLRHEAGRDGLFEPEHLELRFGFDDSPHPAVELDDGTSVRGVIDRVDTWDGWALVRDYKSGKVDSYKASDWEPRNRFQAALYMLVAERVLGLRAAGGVYVPLRGKDRRPRGLVAEELAGELGSDFVKTDLHPAEEFEARTAFLQQAIAEAAGAMAAGRIASCPDTCAWRGGCSHPSICRIEE